MNSVVCFDGYIVKQLLEKDVSMMNPQNAGKTEAELSALTCRRCCNKNMCFRRCTPTSNVEK